MPLAEFVLAAALSVALEESLDRLATLRIANQRPVAVLIVDRDRGDDEAISIYRHRLSGEWTWFARLETHGDGQPRVTWAEQNTCAELLAFASRIERIALPRVELTPQSGQPMPNMGPLHVRHTLWVRATDETGAPVELTLQSLGLGPGARAAETANNLDTCWSDRPPSE